MAFEKQHFAHEWKSVSAAAAEPETISGCFDCNICLDFACDPVVTLCGHLYCWPCIYKWVHFQSSSPDSHDPQCPVCKSEISPTTVVPLYGRGNNCPNEKTDLKEDTEPSADVAVPPRPPACGTKALVTMAQRSSGYDGDTSPPSFSLSGDTAMAAFNPCARVFGEMVYARMFGNSESLFTHPNSYHLTGSTSPRLRRQEMHADKSLNRITIFLFCCLLLCLLFF